MSQDHPENLNVILRVREEFAQLAEERDHLLGQLAALQRALEPVAAWARAVLAPREAEREGTLDDGAVLFKSGEKALTAGDLRAVVAAARGKEGER